MLGWNGFTGRGDVVGEAERSAEAENFARLMRELKERGGLSYGVLARRLHTSTSTLHRYCKGEAVPAEFAVVDRFARACGAGREEAVELHRAWLLADARRRAPAVTEAVPSPVVALPSSPVAVSSPAVAPEPEPEPEREPAPAPAPVGATGPGAPAPWYRRRAVAVAGAGLAVSAMAVAVLAAAGPERGTAGATGAGASAALPSTRPSPSSSSSNASGGPTPTPSPSPSAPPSASGAGAGPSSDPTDGPVPRPSSAQAPPAGGKAPADPAAPLRAAVRSHVWAAGCDHAYLSPREPAAVPPPPVEADAAAWARDRQAVHAGSQIVEVTLHGAGEGAVVLQGMEVRVAARRTPPAWNVYQMSQGCGGGLTPATFAVNLDAPRPLARPVAGNDAGEAIPAPAFPMRVSAAEPVVLRVETATTGCDCDWYLDLRWTGPAGSGTLRLDDGGSPWRTSAHSNRPVYGFATERSRWSR